MLALLAFPPRERRQSESTIAMTNHSQRFSILPPGFAAIGDGHHAGTANSATPTAPLKLSQIYALRTSVPPPRWKIASGTCC